MPESEQLGLYIVTLSTVCDAVRFCLTVGNWALYCGLEQLFFCCLLLPDGEELGFVQWRVL